MKPTINVNLTKCDCSAGLLNAARRCGNPAPVDPLTCGVDCNGVPLIIPCSIPRTVEFTVTLPQRCPTHPHDGGTCEPLRGEPARCVYGEHSMPTPVTVSCSIRGETWEESDPKDIHHADGGYLVDAQTQQIIRERWALVKALLLDTAPAEHPLSTATMLAQRTEVFLALAAMARVEVADFKTSVALFQALKRADPEGSSFGDHPAAYAMGWKDPADEDAPLNSHAGLAAYVEILLEQTKALP